MAYINHLIARRIGTGSQNWDLTRGLTFLFIYGAGFLFLLGLLALFPMTNHGDT